MGSEGQAAPSLKSQVLSGLGWKAGAKLLGQLVSWAITIFVIRLLAPSDYGLLAMAAIFVSFLTLMTELGLEPAMVQSKTLEEGNIRNIFGLLLMIDGSLCALLFLAAPSAASFFNEPRLIEILRVLAFQFILMAFTTIPSAMLRRRMNFKLQSIVELTATIVSGVTTLGLALAGKGVWALVLGNLAGALALMIASNIAIPSFRLPRLSMAGTHDLLRFGGNVTFTRIIWFIYTQADIFIASKLLGKEAVGIYSVSMHLASLPSQKLSAVINQVAFPAFAQIQSDPQRVASNVLLALRVICFITFPICFGMSSVAPELVQVVLGPNWIAATLPLLLICLVIPLRLLSTALTSTTDGLGRPDVTFKTVITAVVVMPIAFLLGCKFGSTGLALAWVIGFPIVFFENLKRILPIIGVSWHQFFDTLLPPVAVSVGMFAAVTGIRWLLADRVPILAQLAVLIVSGAAAYVVLSYLFNRDGLTEATGLIKRKGNALG